MKKTTLFLILCVFTFLPLTSCESSENIKGVVTYIELEGGFYGIITPDGEKYRPLNLPEEFKKDGLEVEFRGEIQDDAIGIHMWGKAIVLEEIKKAS
ncbi:hypothetical protein CHISP_2273 [Chitinispirillum alkaliphilum]|nr:hypothetical protein CHISP_2273 [Chitinispirillum alkaliphilum]